MTEDEKRHRQAVPTITMTEEEKRRRQEMPTTVLDPRDLGVPSWPLAMGSP